jgi:hypothetical protein
MLAGAALVVAGCGGRLDASATGVDSGMAPETGIPVVEGGSVTPALDAAPDATGDAEARLCPTPSGPTCSLASFELCITQNVQNGMPVPGLFRFLRETDVVTYFETLAQQEGLVIAAHGIDCNASVPISASACAWDPLMPRLDASDVHYSNDLKQFSGPDGEPLVWAYLADMNEWIVVDGAEAGALYGAVVQFNECELESQPYDASAD